MNSPRQSRHLFLKALVAVSVLLPALSACGSSRNADSAQDTGTDSVLQSMLESAAENAPERSTSPRLAPEEQEARPTDVASMGYNFGVAEAKVKVLELSDFGCGYCRRFHEEIFPVLREIYVDTGYIEWKFIPFVLGMFPNGLEAATAAECAGEQEKFYGMQGRLFADQSVWRGAEEPYVLFSQIASELDLDVDRFEGCIQNGQQDSRIRANIRLGQQAGVQGTPTFFIDARPLQGALPLDGFRDILDTALRLKGVTPPPR